MSNAGRVTITMVILAPVTVTMEFRVPDDEDGQPDVDGAEVVRVSRCDADVGPREAQEAIFNDPELAQEAVAKITKALGVEP